MTRAEFLSLIKSKMNVQGLGSLYGSISAMISGDKEILAGIHTGETGVYVCKAQELKERPHLVFSSGHPVYLFKKGQDVFAYKAECPEDGNYLQWSDTQNGYYCPICEAKYTLDGNNEQGGKPLVPWPCRQENGQVFIG